MKLNREGNLASFYRYFYLTGDMPNNFCNYFWLLVIAFICTPFTWPAQLYNWYNKKITLRNSTKWREGVEISYTYYDVGYQPVQTVIGLILNLILCVLGMLYTGPFYKFMPVCRQFFDSIPGLLIIPALITSGLIGSFILYYFFIAIGTLIGKIFKVKSPETDEEWAEYYEKQRLKKEANAKRKEYRKNNPNFIKMIGIWFKAYKEKNCPIIEWDEVKPETNEQL